MQPALRWPLRGRYRAIRHQFPHASIQPVAGLPQKAAAFPQTPQVPEALATIAYGYDKLGDQATSKQYIEVLKLNYPNLVKSDGSVNLRAARSEGSWVNRATLGVFGREAQTSTNTEQNQNSDDTQKRSITNRLSFGLLDRPQAETNIPAPKQEMPKETPATE